MACFIVMCVIILFCVHTLCPQARGTIKLTPVVPNIVGALLEHCWGQPPTGWRFSVPMSACVCVYTYVCSLTVCVCFAAGKAAGVVHKCLWTSSSVFREGPSPAWAAWWELQCTQSLLNTYNCGSTLCIQVTTCIELLLYMVMPIVVSG